MSKLNSKVDEPSCTAESPLPSDGYLLGRAAMGEESAFTLLYQRYAQRLLVYFLPRCGNDHELASDLRQQVFMQLLESKAFKAAKSGLLREDLGSLLFAIAANLLKNNYRTKERRQRREQHYGQLSQPKTEHPHFIEVHQLERAMEKLSEAQRVCLQLRFNKGLSISEIAALTGKPPGTVKSRLHYGLQQLRQLLTPITKG